MTRKHPRRTFAPLFALALACMGALVLPGRAMAMQILDAADHAELAAEISATGVNRIALSGDRIAKVVRAPDGYAVEHDAASGDLYLRPAHPSPPGETAAHEPVTLFVGTEKGFTYRLTLTPVARGSAQILIRNAEALPVTVDAAGVMAPAAKSGSHVAALVRVVRAVAGRAPLPGYAIESGGGPSLDGLTLIETWRGPRYAALVFEAGRPAPDGEDGAAGLAGTIETFADIDRVAALWVAAPGTGPSGGRLAVAVTDTAGDRR